jgi:enoyl-CoA hydratase/carnithine racemase
MAKVIYEKRGRIAYIALNRPEQRNALDREMHELLLLTWQDFEADDGVDVAILTGEGEAFCAGMDLKTFVPDILGASPETILTMANGYGLGGITRGLHHIQKPIIAAVNGWALAAGFELALASDIRIASETAMFGSFEARRGFHHGDGGIPRLISICGLGVTMKLVLLAEPVDAQKAMSINLVSRVVAPDKLMEEAEAVARILLRNDQAALRSAKKTILDMIGRRLDDQLRIEAMNCYSRMASGKDVPQRLEQFYRKTDPGRQRGITG